MDGRALRLATVLTVTAIAGEADTYPRQPTIDAQHYTFRLVLRDDTSEIAGDASVDLQFVASDTSDFALDLASPANGKGLPVTDVSSSAGEVRYRHINDRLTITLETPPVARELRTFRIRYHGIPADGLRIVPN